MPRAFTLIELLVVIGIIALLVGILLPALATARRHARSVVGNTNMRSLTQMMLMYTNDNKDAFLDPFSKGCINESSPSERDCTDVALPSTIPDEPGRLWDFDVPLAPQFTTEYFSYYWYSYLLLHEGKSGFGEEQLSPSDSHIRGLIGRYSDSSLRSGTSALWPSSLLYSPTFWTSAERYERGFERETNELNTHGRTQYHASVAFPSSKVLLFERLDFGHKDRVRISTNDSTREGQSPAWNNLGATTAVAVVDGSIEEVAMRDLYAKASETDSDINPSGLGAMIDGPPILLTKGSDPEAVGGGNTADGKYPLFFWATQRGVEGRDLPR